MSRCFSIICSVDGFCALDACWEINKTNETEKVIKTFMMTQRGIIATLYPLQAKVPCHSDMSNKSTSRLRYSSSRHIPQYRTDARRRRSKELKKYFKWLKLIKFLSHSFDADYHCTKLLSTNRVRGKAREEVLTRSRSFNFSWKSRRNIVVFDFWWKTLLKDRQMTNSCFTKQHVHFFLTLRMNWGHQWVMTDTAVDKQHNFWDLVVEKMRRL